MLVLHHDQDYQELTVVYISSVIPPHPSTYDILIPQGSPSGIKAGLRENSVIIARWITVIKRIHIKRKIGEADDDLRARINNVVPICLAIWIRKIDLGKAIREGAEEMCGGRRFAVLEGGYHPNLRWCVKSFVEGFG